jgi:hypothetical protein
MALWSDDEPDAQPIPTSLWWAVRNKHGHLSAVHDQRAWTISRLMGRADAADCQLVRVVVQFAAPVRLKGTAYEPQPQPAHSRRK